MGTRGNWRPIAVCILLAICNVASAQSNLVLLISQSGDYIGQGQTYVTTNQADIGLSGTAVTITVTAFGYNIYFSGPGGTNLTTGVYTNAARWPFNGSQPGLSVFGNGRGCNTLCGSFNILELQTDGSGNVVRLWVTFTQYCECGSTSMTGEIRYASLLAPPAPIPRTLHVPADYSTIQLAVNNASPLAVDTVLVSPGVYNEAVNFNGKRLNLLSVGGPALTSIVGPSGASALTFSSGETSDALVSGFTLNSSGTAVSVSSSSPTIVSNLIANSGTGVNCNFASPIIRSNSILNCSGNAIYLGGAATPLIEGNIIRTNNGAIYMFAAGSPTIRNNLIQGSHADGLNMVNQSDANIIQNLIYENTGNGIYWLVPSGARGPWVINNTILSNTGSGILADGYDAAAQIVNNIIIGSPGLNVGSFNDTNPPVVLYNDIYSPTGAAYAGLIPNLTGISGNISADPLFTCNLTRDFHLLAVSRCVDAGTNGAPMLPGADFDGSARILDGDTNGTATTDMGAYEFNPSAARVPCLYITCPPSQTIIAAQGQNSAIVSYAAPSAAPVASVSCIPPSGSVFTGGTNIVTCTASYGTNSVSCTFAITVVVPPTIATQPQNTNVLAGQIFSLSVLAAGTAPLTYTWAFEGVTVAGATGPVLTVTNAQSANEGVYRGVIANTAGSVTSSVVRVRVLPAAPTIVSGPSPLTVPAGSNATFSVSASGSLPMFYQWWKGSVPLAGATASQLIITNAQASDVGNYQVVVSNSVGTAASAAAMLTVTSGLPFFVQQPSSATISTGATVTLTVLARGSAPLTYQWRQNSANLPGATQPSLVLSNVTLASAGAYDAVASNPYGTATSAVAQVTVNQAPLLQQGLANQTVDAGSTLLLTVAATGTPVLTYTWRFDSAVLTNSGPSLVLSNLQTSQSGYYRVTVGNQLGSISSTGRVSVFGPMSSVIAWGDNSGGQTNVPAGLNDVVAASGGDFHTLALRRNGALAAWGYNGDGQVTLPTNATRFVSIASGSGHNLAIMENGKVIAWGRNDGGQINVPATVSSAISVAGGDSHSLALLSSGTIIAWGTNNFGQVTGASGLTGIAAIAAGRNHNLALRTNGTVTAWGLNNYGQTTVPSGLSGVASVAAGYLHSVALLSNGTVVCWGDNSFGQTNRPTGLSNVVAIAAGDFHTLALRADGSVIGWGDNSYGQVNIPAQANYSVGVSSGYYHGLALAPAPMLQYGVSAAGLVMKWNGPFVLQWAPGPAGPYNDMPGLAGGFTNYDYSLPAKFFRLRR